MGKKKYQKKTKLIDLAPRYVQEIIGLVKEIEEVETITLSRMRESKKPFVTTIQAIAKQKKQFIKCKIYHPNGDVHIFEVRPDTDLVFQSIQKLFSEL